jgi:hypothetical protein
MTLKGQNRFGTVPSKLRFSGLIRFDTLPALTRKNLHNLADKVAEVVPVEQKSWLIQTSEISLELKILNEVQQWAGKGSKFLYYLQLIGQADLDAIRKAYSSSRYRDRGTRAYARLIKSKPSITLTPEKLPPCLYVGSSSNIYQRLKEHLGYGAKTTFSLQLAHWTQRLDLELNFTCAKYINSPQPEVFQALEDTLWGQLHPMFGRRGGR